MSDEVKIGDVVVQPGQRKFLRLPVPQLYTHTQMNMPVHVIRGEKAGPRLFVSGALHGDELNGVEIARRLLGLKLLNRVRGTLIVVPVVNVYGFLHQSRYLPDRRDLNRFFPGSEKGSLTSRLADIYMRNIVQGSTYGIDFHAGSNHRVNLPQIRAQLGDPDTRRIALAFKSPVVLNAELREGSLRQIAEEQGIKMLLYEAGEALRFDDVAIRLGVRGVISVMEEVGMLAKSRRRSKIEPQIAESTSWVRAPVSGIFRTTVPLGAKISRQSKIGVIADPFGADQRDVLSPYSGIVIGRLNLPLVHQGDAIFHIARFTDATSASSTIEDFQEEFIESSA